METYKMGTYPYEPEEYNGSNASIGIATTDGRVIASVTNKSSIAKEFAFKVKLMYFLYFKRVPLFCEKTKKVIRPNRLMTFRLKNLGNNKITTNGN